MERTLIDAPYANKRGVPGATRVLGPFAVHRNRDRWVGRYYPSISGHRKALWADNAISLDTLCHELATTGNVVTRCVLALTAWHHQNWDRLMARSAGLVPAGIVMDATCLGTEMTMIVGLFKRFHKTFPATPVIVRLPAVGYMPLVIRAVDAGLNSFQCCGPLRVPGGGLHGRPLQTLSLRALADVSNYLHSQDIARGMLVGAGGVIDHGDVSRYLATGATHIMLGGVYGVPFVGRARAARLVDQVTHLASGTYEDVQPVHLSVGQP